jgi:putative membrane protein
MGIAELVPGVSGGTIAFITGIYVELVDTIRGLGPALLRRVLRGELRVAWRQANAPFLVVLGAGMASGILALAHVVSWLLEYRQLEVWGFFFGLILASTVFVARFARPFTPGRRWLVGGGLAVGAGAAFLGVMALPVHPLTIFFGGMVAVCAWVLPGVSGSFVMLVLGLYPAVVAAIGGLDLAFLAILAAGCTTGLLLFARVLGWLLDRYYRGTLALLCGFMAGSLLTLWPWRVPVSVVDGKPVGVRLLLPDGFAAAGGGDPAVVGVVLAVAGGVAVVGALELLSRAGGTAFAPDASEPDGPPTASPRGPGTPGAGVGDEEVPEGGGG